MPATGTSTSSSRTSVSARWPPGAAAPVVAVAAAAAVAEPAAAPAAAVAVVVVVVVAVLPRRVPHVGRVSAVSRSRRLPVVWPRRGRGCPAALRCVARPSVVRPLRATLRSALWPAVRRDGSRAAVVAAAGGRGPGVVAVVAPSRSPRGPRRTLTGRRIARSRRSARRDGAAGSGGYRSRSALGASTAAAVASGAAALGGRALGGERLGNRRSGAGLRGPGRQSRWSGRCRGPAPRR